MATATIKQRAQAHIPVTYKALETAGEFGSTLLDVKAENIKQDLFGTEVSEQDEQAYNSAILDYGGLLLAIELIDPGIDYWMTRSSSFSATGQNETKLYVDRAEKLREQRDFLISKAKEKEPVVLDLLGTLAHIKTRRKAIKVGDPDEDRLISPNPWDFERPFAEPNVVEF